tara:strand:+ start:290 stop:544 length:255 start_codon:yes stop_codon:yes gene_type:complete
MDSIKRNLKRAREAPALSREQYSIESWMLGTIKGMVSFWADEYTLRGDKLKGQDLVRWKKEVYSRIQELDAIFKEDEKLKKEVK